MVVNPERMTIEQAAASQTVSVSTLRRWVKRGAPCYRIGHVVRFSLQELSSWVEAHAVGGSEPAQGVRTRSSSGLLVRTTRSSYRPVSVNWDQLRRELRASTPSTAKATDFHGDSRA